MTDLPPGPELDRAVAEKVMGLEHRDWKPYCAAEGWYPKDYPSCVPRDRNGRSGPESYPDDYRNDLPMYSTRIQDAWEVVRELESQGWEQIDLSKDWDSRKWRLRLGRWAATVGGHTVINDLRPDGRRSLLESTEPEHAICLAALAAVGYPEERARARSESHAK